MVTILITSRDSYCRVEALDADGAGLLLLLPAFATVREAELHAVAELERMGIDPARILVDRGEQ